MKRKHGDLWKIYRANIKATRALIRNAMKGTVTSFKLINVSYLRNLEHFPCRYRVISTRVEIGKTKNRVESRRPQGEIALTQFRIFLTSTGVGISFIIAQRTSTEERQEIFRVELRMCYKNTTQLISLQNLHMLYYKVLSNLTITKSVSLRGWNQSYRNQIPLHPEFTNSRTFFIWFYY